MKQFVSFAALMLLCGLTACGGRHISDSNLDQVKPGMSSKEVEAILGPPTRSEAPPEPETEEVTHRVTVTHYYYEQNGHKVELTFVGDRLPSGGVNGHFEK